MKPSTPKTELPPSAQLGNRLISHRFSLDEIARGYQIFGERSDGVLKVAIKPQPMKTASPAQLVNSCPRLTGLPCRFCAVAALEGIVAQLACDARCAPPGVTRKRGRKGGG